MQFVTLQESMLGYSCVVQRAMDELLPANYSESKIVESMRYSALSQGKRIRPFLLMASANIFGFPSSKTIAVACALEFVHVYSLIHDDLPAMDNDDFRRGKPSNHKKFDEATAILAGDGLLTYAFEILSSPEAHSNPEIRCEIIRIIANSAGYKGMVGGQMIDIENINNQISKEQIVNIHRLKTGELFMACAECGAVLGGANSDQRKAIRHYAHDLSLAFQIKDDILDHCDVSIVNPIDEFSHKKPKENTSIVDIIGLEKSKQQLDFIKEQAKEHVRIFGERARLLVDLVDFVVNRTK